MPGSESLAIADAQRFQQEYWRRQPLVQRMALSQPQVRLTPEEIAELATDPEFLSRIVMGDTAEQDWMTVEGPVTETFFSDTPERDWQVTVWGLDRHIPAFAGVREAFRCLPDWRFSGISASYAAPGGTAGTVSDDADVFLLQVSGTKAWDLEWTDAGGEPCSMQVALEPGDTLYLPPAARHYGVAATASVTYAIRFRAPSPGELFLAWATDIAVELDRDTTVPTDDPLERPGDIPATTLVALRQQLRAGEGYSDHAIEAWLAHYLTRSAVPLAPLLSSTEPTAEAIREALARGRALIVNGALRLALVEGPGGLPRLFVDGREETVTPRRRYLVEALSARRRITGDDLGQGDDEHAEQLALLERGLGDGWLLFDDELEG